MKKIVAFILLMVLCVCSVPAQAETPFSGNAQYIYDAIRWNLNLPKESIVTHAEEYLFKLNKEITLHALLMEVTLCQDLDMMYGLGGRLVLVDLDSGEIIDYKSYDGNVMWPDGEVTSKYDALHLLYGSYRSYVEGYNEFIMSEYEYVIPIAEEEIAAINVALMEAFIR